MSTIFFTIIWLLDPSILSTLSLIGLTLTISDYLVPVVAKSMFKAETWTPTKEKQFDELCQSIIVYYNKIDASFATYVEKRTTNPKLVSVSRFSLRIRSFCRFLFAVLPVYDCRFGASRLDRKHVE